MINFIELLFKEKSQEDKNLLRAESFITSMKDRDVPLEDQTQTITFMTATLLNSTNSEYSNIGNRREVLSAQIINLQSMLG